MVFRSLKASGLYLEKSSRTAPLRLFGFGFYWAWVFTCIISASPVFGSITLFAQLPFELVYFCFRTVCLLLIVVVSRAFAQKDFTRALTLICIVVGPLATASIGFLAHSVVHPLLALTSCLFVGLTDAAMFVVWLAFFGEFGSKNTIAYFGASYALGALISVVIAQMVSPFDYAIAVLLPVFAGIACFLSQKYNPDESLSEERQKEVAEGQFYMKESRYTFPFFGRMLIAFAAYGLLLGLYKAIPLYWNAPSAFDAAFIHIPCSILLGLAVFFGARTQNSSDFIHMLYKLIPLVFAIGFVVMLFIDLPHLVFSGLFIAFAYNAFEMLAFGALVDIVYRRQLSSLFIISLGRLINSFGILLGILLVMALWNSGFDASPLLTFAGIGILIVVVMGTIVFSERELFSVIGLYLTMNPKDTPQEPSAYSSSTSLESVYMSISDTYGLSNREREVLPLIAKGRNPEYVSKVLYISVGTAKTHIYNIYRKMSIHTRQEMLDIVDEFTEASQEQENSL